jgi:hypothetical protein
VLQLCRGGDVEFEGAPGSESKFDVMGDIYDASGGVECRFSSSPTVVWLSISLGGREAIRIPRESPSKS